MANTRKFNRKKTLIGAAVFVVVLLGWSYYSKTSRAAISRGDESTYPVTRQDMTISVLESGSLKPKKSVVIRSEVEGDTTIVDIIPEGTVLTQADVDTGKVILELDTSSTKEDLNRQQIAYNTAMADFTDARESLDIQKNQNESDIQQGKLAVKFGLMDLEKYLGQSAAEALVSDANDRPATDEDFTKLTRDPNQLGGESLQKYRQLTADINMAMSEYKVALTTLNWTEKLYAKKYVAKTELDSDKLKADKSIIAHEQAQTAIDLFIRYEFPKDAHKFFSDYVEAKRELERILAKARSQEAQAVAKMANAEAKFALEKERLEKLQRQLAASIVKAPCPGMVVYRSQDMRGGTRSRTSIEVGREVREREEIMSIPSASDLLVDTKVHETNVDKIAVGQKAKITVDAMPDMFFSGEVLKIAPLPDPGSFMSNPDLKLYATDVTLDGGQMLRPGMSAKVEIIIAQLKDVLAIPIQCVSNQAGKKICYVHTSSKSEEREIKVGSYNDKFVQILEGLKEGEKVLLNPPRIYNQPQQNAAAKSADDNQAESEQRPGGPREQDWPDRQMTGDKPQSNRPLSPDGQLPNGQTDSPRPRRQRPSGKSPTDGQQPGEQMDSQRPQRQRPGSTEGGDKTSARETQ
ncbi:MAG: HlyD family efflux transporter periplasmic adaptor subunit [Planctomycetes bacterium]|nr:HlyD family efflux transporter periplasmic adaptor subunit [Planctomycetota bacterium]